MMQASKSCLLEHFFPDGKPGHCDLACSMEGCIPGHAGLHHYAPGSDVRKRRSILCLSHTDYVLKQANLGVGDLVSYIITRTAEVKVSQIFPPSLSHSQGKLTSCQNLCTVKPITSTAPAADSPWVTYYRSMQPFVRTQKMPWSIEAQHEADFSRHPAEASQKSLEDAASN